MEILSIENNDGAVADVEIRDFDKVRGMCIWCAKGFTRFSTPFSGWKRPKLVRREGCTPIWNVCEIYEMLKVRTNACHWCERWMRSLLTALISAHLLSVAHGFVLFSQKSLAFFGSKTCRKCHGDGETRGATGLRDFRWCRRRNVRVMNSI